MYCILMKYNLTEYNFFDKKTDKTQYRKIRQKGRFSERKINNLG